ncbi:MAG: NUDIX hydrolase [Ardenticatenaceae bacterium]|nr:NUDIX hydrolase [Ardenticatenaceae bacterium]MCB9443545.1 NUDIX hydrolase [Ardenticatenaceae bacterium]
MSLAVKDLRYQHLENKPEKFRLWFVRSLSLLLCKIPGHCTPQQRVPLMTEPYKKLEEIARARTRALAQVQQSAFAIIAIGQENERRYLLQWNANWQMFNLIGGKVDNNKGDNNCFRRTIERELEEELGIICPQECRVGRELGQLRLQQYSHRQKTIKNYQFALFDVQILPNLPIDWDSPHYFARWLSTGRENIFVSADEIQNLSTVNGRPISATTRHVLQFIGEVPIFHQKKAE